MMTNYTRPNGEIDLIMEDATQRIYVEVKSIDGIDDLHGFVTPRKLERVRRTMRYHMRVYPTKKAIRLDVVFVKNNAVAHVYEHVHA